MSDKFGRADRAEHIIQVRRCACVVKGGRRFSFGALLVVGDGCGGVGVGYAKAPEVPVAVEKALKCAERNTCKVPLRRRGESCSVEHKVYGKFGASRVVILPAGPGTGVIAGGVVRSVLSAAGYTDIIAKSLGSGNPATLVRATLVALGNIRDRAAVTALRAAQSPSLGGGHNV